MATESGLRNAVDSDELNSPTSPGADYGLLNGFDPARYDFYNPLPRGNRKGPTRSVDEYVRCSKIQASLATNSDTFSPANALTIPSLTRLPIPRTRAMKND